MLPNIAFSFLLLTTTTKIRKWIKERKQKFHYFLGRKESYIKLKTENIYKKLRNDGGLIFKL